MTPPPLPHERDLPTPGGKPPPPRPMPWPLVAGIAAAVVAILAILTLAFPGFTAGAHRNAVQVGGLTATLTAGKASGPGRQIRLQLAIDPPPPDATIALAATMPTMENMPAGVTPVTQDAPGRYTATAQLSMGGSWEVRATIRRPGLPDATATFLLNA